VGVAWKQSVSPQMWQKPEVDGMECFVCLRDKDRKNSVNSASVQNVCARTALTDSSGNKQQLQGTIIILRDFFHIQFCVVAWEMEDRNEIIFLNIFHFCL